MDCSFFIKLDGVYIPIENLDNKSIQELLNYMDICAIKCYAEREGYDIMEIKPILKNIL